MVDITHQTIKKTKRKIHPKKITQQLTTKSSKQLTLNPVESSIPPQTQ
jgi:hypothetical protein